MILTFDIESQNILVSKLKKCASNKTLHSTLPSPKPQNVHFVQIFLLYLEWDFKHKTLPEPSHAVITNSSV